MASDLYHKLSSARIVTATTGGRDAYDSVCRARTYISILRNFSRCATILLADEAYMVK